MSLRAIRKLRRAGAGSKLGFSTVGRTMVSAEGHRLGQTHLGPRPETLASSAYIPARLTDDNGGGHGNFKMMQL
jgi:hypothetical protein